MQSLALSMRARGDEGQSLPDVFNQLGDLGAHIRRGQLHLFAGPPGGGKSAVASFLATKMIYDDGSKVPTLYFSPDSDKGTLGVRLAAGVIHRSLEETELILEDDDAPEWKALEGEMDHIWFCWDQAPTMDDINSEIEAYVTVTGEFPHVIIVDNLKNMVSENPNEAKHVEYDEIMEALKVLAGDTHSAVVVLHHVTGMYENGTEPIPLNGLLGKPGKACRLIVTLWTVERFEGQVNLGMSIVKNSNGKAQADGQFGATVAWNAEKSWFDTGR